MLRTVLAEHELIIGEVIMTELRRALTRKLRLPEDRVMAVEAVFSAIPLVPKPAESTSVRWVLATAIAGGADALVTGDEDRLAVASDAPLKILTPRAFWQLLRGG